MLSVGEDGLQQGGTFASHFSFARLLPISAICWCEKV